MLRRVAVDVISLLNDAVTILRATPATDRYGNTVPGSVTETDVYCCAVIPPGSRLSTTGGSEGVYLRDTVEGEMILLAPLDTDIVATDRVRHAGTTYEVDGRPERFAMTSLRHVAARLKVVTG